MWLCIYLLAQCQLPHIFLRVWFEFFVVAFLLELMRQSVENVIVEQG